MGFIQVRVSFHLHYFAVLTYRMGVDPSLSVNLVLYIAFAVIVAVVFVIIYFVYEYWWARKHANSIHSDFEEIHDDDGYMVQQTNTICSVGVGIRMDNAPTRPKLQVLRAASMPTREELPTGTPLQLPLHNSSSSVVNQV
ncbi:hypothetical protein LEN26_009220 [Aphanomyces euteiches]|nr:hypothetical protein AeMF1_007134 [Aphanomyces euteiches]KAH9127663.1 hypothetical protein LEN26_009220 [Aphanomyces euteiches]